MSKPNSKTERAAEFSTETLKVEIRRVEYRILVEGKPEQKRLDALCKKLSAYEEC